MGGFPTAMAAGLLLISGSAFADIVKTDLRSSPQAAEGFLAFCTGGSDAVPLLSFVDGDRNSGFSTRRISRARKQMDRQEELKACVTRAQSGASLLFIVELDPNPYAQALDAFDQLQHKFGDDYTALAIGLGQIIGLKLPTKLKTSSHYLKMLSELNTHDSQNGGQWIWQPPAIKRIESTKPSQSSPQQSRANFLETGLKSAPYVDRDALQRLYLVLADAIDNPNVDYTIELRMEHGVLRDVLIHPLEMKRDKTLLRGDAVCVYAGADTANVNVVELLDTILALPATHRDQLSRSWGFSPEHPLLGAPNAWQAIVTTPPACYAAAFDAAATIADLPFTGGMKYVTTLIRGFPHYPGAAYAFNSAMPLPVHVTGVDYTLDSTERAWTEYRQLIIQAKKAVESTWEPFSKLPEVQAAYAMNVARNTERGINFRSYFQLREIGWHEYQANRYKHLQDQLVQGFKDGESVLYDLAQKNSKMLQTADIGPSLVAELGQYQAFMTTAVMSKEVVAQQFSKDMTSWGRVCDLAPARCSTAIEEIGAGVDHQVRWKYADNEHREFGGTLKIGATASAPTPNLEATFGAEPAGARCTTSAEPSNAVRGGLRTFELKVTNSSSHSRVLMVSYVGSWTRAWWDKTESGHPINLEPGAEALLKVEFEPGAGYEDFNAIYLIEGGYPVSELVLDYWTLGESPLRTLEMDSGNVESGTGSASGTYEIGIGGAPTPFAFRKACVWVSGDRTDCVNNKWSTCTWESSAADKLIAQFTLEGHTDAPASRPLSTGHLRAVYQATTEPVTLE